MLGRRIDLESLIPARLMSHGAILESDGSEKRDMSTSKVDFQEDRRVTDFLFDLAARVIHGHSINTDEAKRIAQIPHEQLLLLCHTADRLRRHFRGDRVTCCSIVNAKSGNCPEDCAFCSQSVHHNTEIQTYALIETGRIIDAAKQAAEKGASGLGVVISGAGIDSEDELRRIGDAIERIATEAGIEAHGSLGTLDEAQLGYLKSRGMVCFNHNLETAESHFERVVGTHTYQSRVDTVRVAKKAGLRVCCGGILGMGENLEQRIELAMALRDLDVDIVPLNFLNAIPGTPLEDLQPLSPLEILSTIALYGFILPDKEIKVAGGREKNLRDLQSMIFFAGADGIIIGNYLTTLGRPPEVDREMLSDLRLSIRLPGEEA